MKICTRLLAYLKPLAPADYPILPDLFPEPDEKTRVALERLWKRLLER